MINTLGSVGSVMRLSKPTMFIEKNSNTLDQDADFRQEPEVKSVDSDGILTPDLHQ